MKKMMVIAAVGLMAAMTFTAQCAEKAQDGVQGKRQADVVVKLPGIQKIDMENLLDVPVGSTLLDTGIKRVTQEEDGHGDQARDAGGGRLADRSPT